MWLRADARDCKASLGGLRSGLCQTIGDAVPGAVPGDKRSVSFFCC
jgi:hypothetical protein